MHSMPDNNSPSMTMNVSRLCSPARASTRSSGTLISSAPISWLTFHIFPAEMPSATRIATVSARCSSRLWHSTQVELTAGSARI